MPPAETDNDLSNLDDQLHDDIQGGNKSKSTKAKSLSHVPCRFYKMGACTAGQACQFSHTIVDRGGKDVCQWYVKGNCKFGHKCALAHVLPGQPMGMDRKNKKAAQVATQANTSKNERTVIKTSRNQQNTSPRDVSEAPSGRSQPKPFRALSQTAPGNISATAPSHHDLSDEDETEQDSSKISFDLVQSSALPTPPSDTPPISEIPTRPAHTLPSNKQTLDLASANGSPPHVSSARQTIHVAPLISPGTSPTSKQHERSTALSSSPFSGVTGKSPFFNHYEPQNTSQLRPNPISSTLSRPIGIQPHESWQNDAFRSEKRSAIAGDSDEDLGDFLPSSLNDLLTPEERQRRLSRSGTSRPGAFQSGHQYSRSVPAAGLLDSAIWKENASEREISTSMASVSFRSGFGSEGPSPSLFPTSNASGAFLTQFQRGTQPHGRSFMSQSYDRDEVGVLPQIGAARQLRYEQANPALSALGTNRIALAGSDASSPSARALQAHAPGQSLPQGLAAGLSRLHLLPPSSQLGVLGDLSEDPHLPHNSLRGQISARRESGLSRSPANASLSNAMSLSHRDPTSLASMSGRGWPSGINQPPSTAGLAEATRRAHVGHRDDGDVDLFDME